MHRRLHLRSHRRARGGTAAATERCLSPHRFDDRINALSDQDWAWWPLLALRPRREQPLSEARLFLIALLFGGLCAAVSVALVWLLFGSPLPLAIVTVAALTFALFYLTARLTLFRSWNRRALRLQRANAQRED
ncbi:MAG: hypothetical protein BGP24_17175 [Lysobacterales bacterium 69-70]|nr:MAG: hypothetical protein ABT27_21095 [Xanthomonadaceae bacterium SCN 69-25]OJZ00246.1 MAG: hypothetical protein BGP24_17175 [Xanthomonadales bacterium 69-70]